MHKSCIKIMLHEVNEGKQLSLFNIFTAPFLPWKAIYCYVLWESLTDAVYCFFPKTPIHLSKLSKNIIPCLGTHIISKMCFTVWKYWKDCVLITVHSIKHQTMPIVWFSHDTSRLPVLQTGLWSLRLHHWRRIKFRVLQVEIIVL